MSVAELIAQLRQLDPTRDVLFPDLRPVTLLFDDDLNGVIVSDYENECACIAENCGNHPGADWHQHSDDPCPRHADSPLLPFDWDNDQQQGEDWSEVA